MDENQYNSLIDKVATIMENDDVSIDEQDVQKLQKYKNHVKSNSHLNDEDSLKLVYESLLYLKLKNSDSGDPLQKGDEFGAGFSWTYPSETVSISFLDTPFQSPIIPSGFTSSTLVMCWIFMWSGVGGIQSIAM